MTIYLDLFQSRMVLSSGMLSEFPYVVNDAGSGQDGGDEGAITTSTVNTIYDLADENS